MKREKILECIKSLIKDNSQENILKVMDEIGKDNEKLELSVTNYETDNTSIKSENEMLKKANNRLLTQFADLKLDFKDKNEEEKGGEETEGNEELTFDGLFNENGELK